jgi:hypothetical protein
MMALLRDDSSGLPNHRHRSGHRLGTIGLHLLPARLEIVVLACDAVVVIVKVIVYQIVDVGIVSVRILIVLCPRALERRKQHPAHGSLQEYRL